MKVQQRFVVLLIALVSFNWALAEETVTLEDGSALELKGIGLAQEFRTDIYIGALYAPVGFKSLDLYKDFTTPKRITVRYLADNYSYRKVGRHFKERIAMNNSRETWGPLTREIVTFSKLFKQNIVSGDELRLDYVPGKGTMVYLNGVLFETFSKPEFFNLMLNAWTGNVPPSKQFKDGITGNIPAEMRNQLLNQYAQLTPVKGRFKKLEVAEEQPPAEPPKAQPKPKPQPKKQVAKAEPKTKPKATPKAEPKKQTVEKPKAQPKKEPPKPEPKKQVVKKKPEPLPEEDFIDEDLIRGSYIRDLIAEVNKEQSYPKKALVNREEGDGTALVTIDRAGEIIDVVMIEKTGSRNLDKGIMRMIRKASPFPTIPKELKEEKFEFEIPFSFKL